MSNKNRTLGATSLIVISVIIAGIIAAMIWSARSRKSNKVSNPDRYGQYDSSSNNNEDEEDNTPQWMKDQARENAQLKDRQYQAETEEIAFKRLNDAYEIPRDETAQLLRESDGVMGEKFAELLATRYNVPIPKGLNWRHMPDHSANVQIGTRIKFTYLLKKGELSRPFSAVYWRRTVETPPNSKRDMGYVFDGDASKTYFQRRIQGKSEGSSDSSPWTQLINGEEVPLAETPFPLHSSQIFLPDDHDKEEDLVTIYRTRVR